MLVCCSSFTNGGTHRLFANFNFSNSAFFFWFLCGFFVSLFSCSQFCSAWYRLLYAFTLVFFWWWKQHWLHFCTVKINSNFFSSFRSKKGRTFIGLACVAGNNVSFLLSFPAVALYSYFLVYTTSFLSLYHSFPLRYFPSSFLFLLFLPPLCPFFLSHIVAVAFYFLFAAYTTSFFFPYRPFLWDCFFSVILFRLLYPSFPPFFLSFSFTYVIQNIGKVAFYSSFAAYTDSFLLLLPIFLTFYFSLPFWTYFFSFPFLHTSEILLLRTLALFSFNEEGNRFSSQWNFAVLSEAKATQQQRREHKGRSVKDVDLFQQRIRWKRNVMLMRAGRRLGSLFSDSVWSVYINIFPVSWPPPLTLRYGKLSYTRNTHGYLVSSFFQLFQWLSLA